MVPDLSRRDRMVAMYQRGCGTGDIAAEFGIRAPAVRTALIRAGIYRGAPRRGPKRSPKTELLMSSLAEHVSEGGDISDWARANGLRNTWGHQLWSKICRDLGEQAA